MKEQRTALILGATGLIGSELLTILLNSKEYSQVTIIVRRKIQNHHAKLKQVEISDFEQLSNHSDLFKVTDVYSCLGTTIKKAKSKENFKKVDYDYTLLAAELASENHVDNFLTVTALGSNPNSMFFYNQVKGNVERDLKKIPLSCVHIFQPSLLLGNRNEYRAGEKMAEKVSSALPFLFSGPLKKYKPIEGKTVAESIYKKALQNQKGFFIHASDSLY
ncbi:NAD-dependent epimerase/dehydratase family protein [Bacillus sp. 31A1R]|uniref:NAD-dependent epimerase/dehydratase family protein n=1 Tax=Robertmurraya mangrovi TaxID=3098077 RepID=A0ABU5J546_9BACI|nr:NAD-dependent epimerase/dehydratase family protein [Bacillus sp. 31A1R]MDZ5474491.1 NAD-dependent epimerase/dehydratase family protein [Bacillus sp. 31A1R]